MRITAVLLGLLLSAHALAHDITYTWTHATTRTDGTAITGARSYVLNVSKGGVTVANVTATGTTHTVTGLSSGEYVARIATVEAGMTGPYSVPVTTIIPAEPSAPAGLRGVVITVNVTIQPAQ